MKRLLVGAAIAVPVLGALKKRQIVKHLAGRSEAEARELIIAKATPRVGADKAQAVADKIVTRMNEHGLLAEPTSA